MSSNAVLVSGLGMGGPTLAFWLRAAEFLAEARQAGARVAHLHPEDGTIGPFIVAFASSLSLESFPQKRAQPGH